MTALSDEFKTASGIPVIPRSEANDWKSVESRVGARFTEDYRDIVYNHGTIAIHRFFVFFSPWSPEECVNLMNKPFSTLELWSKAKYPYEYNDRLVPLFPEESGLFPFGVTDNGDVISMTLGDDGVLDGPVVVINERSGDVTRFDMTVGEFFLNLVRGTTGNGFFDRVREHAHELDPIRNKCKSIGP